MVSSPKVDSAAKVDSTTRTVDRALALLSIVCRRGSIQLSDAARDVGLSPSTGRRLLLTLETAGYVRRDAEGLYRPGATILQLGAVAISRESLIAMCQSPMEQVVERTGESAYLSIDAAGATGLYIAIREGTQSVRHANWVGRTFPLQDSAAGAALRGEAPARGYAVAGGLVESDVTAISVPVQAEESVLGALSVVVPSYRLTSKRIEEFGQVLLDESRDIYAHFDARKS